MRNWVDVAGTLASWLVAVAISGALLYVILYLRHGLQALN